MRLPTKIIFPIAKQRPKTLWLRKGFEDLGIPLINSPKWIWKLRPPENSRGPYVYPIEIFYENKSKLILYDIGTNPKQFYPALMKTGRLYFKTHLHKHDRKKYPNVFVAPNSASNMEYLGHVKNMRDLKNDHKYVMDFFFCGWNDDDGLRRKVVSAARKNRRWETLAGLQPFKHHTTVSPQLFRERIPYEKFLRWATISKLNLALPGGRALPYMSFRHVEFFGMGCAVITKPPDAVLPGKISQCQIEFNPNMSDFEEKVDYYLHHDEEREAIAERGMQYYEKYLKPESNAKYILEIVERRISG